MQNWFAKEASLHLVENVMMRRDVWSSTVGWRVATMSTVTSKGFTKTHKTWGEFDNQAYKTHEGDL